MSKVNIPSVPAEQLEWQAQALSRLKDMEGAEQRLAESVAQAQQRSILETPSEQLQQAVPQLAEPPQVAPQELGVMREEVAMEAAQPSPEEIAQQEQMQALQDRNEEALLTQQIRRAMNENARSAIENRLKGGQEMFTSTGEPMTFEQQVGALEKEITEQSSLLPLTNQYDYRKMILADSMNQKKSDNADTRKVQEYAQRSFRQFSQFNFQPVNAETANASNTALPESKTATDFFMEMSNSTEADIMNAYVEESLAMAAEAVRDPDARRQEQAEEATVSSMEDLEALTSMEADVASKAQEELNPEAFNSPIPLEAYKSRIGTKFKRNLANKKKAQGINPDSSLSNMNNTSIGDILLRNQLNTGFVRLTNDGKGVVLGDLGIETYQAGKRIDSIKRQQSEVRGTFATTPAPYNENVNEVENYHSFQPLSAFRNKKFRRYSSTGKRYSTTKPVRRANAILGRSAYTTEAHKLAGVGLISAIALHPNQFGQAFSDFAKDLLSIGNKKIRKMAGKDPIAIQSEIQNEASAWIKTTNTYLDSLLSGVPMYVYHQVDDYNGRPYTEAYFVGWQGNTPSRALTSNAKRHKNTVNFTKNNMEAVKKALEDGNMDIIADSVSDDLLNNYNKLSPRTITIFSLLYQQAVLDNTVDPDTETFARQIRKLNMGKINEYASHGRAIRALYKEAGLVNPDGTINSDNLRNALPQEEIGRDGQPTGRAALTQTGITGGAVNAIPSLQDPNSPASKALDFVSKVKGIDHKNFGQVLSALEDAARFVDALQTGGNYIPSTIGSADMQMAGGTVFAYGIGDSATLARSGVDWELQPEDVKDLQEGISRIKNNRVAFAEEMNRVLEDYYHIDRIFKVENHNDAYTYREMGEAWHKEITELSKDKDWASALAKGPKMTTRYGRPAMSHWDTMKGFLQGKGSKIFDNMAAKYDSNVDRMADDLARIVEQALLREAGRDADRFIKEATNMLGLFGLTPRYKGFFGNYWEVGTTHLVDTEKQGSMTMPDGTVVEISNVKSELDMGARKEPKFVVEYDRATKQLKETWRTPPKYSMTSLSTLPQFGQAAEAEMMTAVINAINPTDADLADPKFAVHVFDNYSGDMASLAAFVGAANSHKGILKKVLQYDRIGAFVDGYRERKQELIATFKQIAAEKGMVDIGTAGDFTGILHQGDNVYADIAKMKEEGTWEKPGNEYWTARLKELKKIFDAMGYKPEGTDRTSILVDPQKFLTNIKVVPVDQVGKANAKGKDIPAILAFDYFWNLDRTADRLKAKRGAAVPGLYEGKRQAHETEVGASKFLQQMLFMMPGL